MAASHVGLPWYAVQVWSRQEQAIASVIQGKGFETFAPCYPAVRLISGRKRKVELALFPGYIFCRMDAQQRLPVITAPGVIAILGNGKQAIPVEEDEVQSIRRTVESGLKAEPFGSLGAGERVRLNAGPLAGLEGIVVGDQGRPKLIVSVTLLNRSVSVEIEQEWVSAAGSRPAPPAREETPWRRPAPSRH